MTFYAAKSIVTFGGTLWWALIKFGRTKLTDEHKMKSQLAILYSLFLFVI